MRITVHHRHELGPDTLAAISELTQAVGAILKQGKLIMAALDDLKAAVAAEQTVEQSAITLLNGLTGQLQALVAASNGSVSAADIEAVVASVNANKDGLAAAVAANTPAAPAA